MGPPQELSLASTHVYPPPSHNTVCFEWCLTQSMSGHKQASLSSFMGWWGFCILAPEGRIALNRLTHTQRRGSPSVGETPQYQADPPASGRPHSVEETPQCRVDPPAPGGPPSISQIPSAGRIGQASVSHCSSSRGVLRGVPQSVAPRSHPSGTSCSAEPSSPVAGSEPPLPACGQHLASQGSPHFRGRR